MADEAQPRQLNPYSAFTGPLADAGKDFSMTPQRVDHRHPAVAAVESLDSLKAVEGIAPDAEPVPTPATPTPRPDGQPPAPDAVVPVVAATSPAPVAGETSNGAVAVVNIPEGSGSFTA